MSCFLLCIISDNTNNLKCHPDDKITQGILTKLPQSTVSGVVDQILLTPCLAGVGIKGGDRVESEAIGCKISRCWHHLLQSQIYNIIMCVFSMECEPSLHFVFPFAVLYILFLLTSFDSPSSPFCQSCWKYIGWGCQVILTGQSQGPHYRYS